MDTAEINDDDDDYANQETYFLPAVDQRIFGAGIKRKRVPFIPASNAETSIATPPKTAVGDRYLSIVLKNQDQAVKSSNSATVRAICEICGQPVDASHESSISHQFCLEHSHPPSHLPRDHIGMKILGSHGWDPDSQLGLGATGEGIRVPIKGTIKNDTVGLGMATKPRTNGRIADAGEREGTKRLNAKEVRIDEEKARMRTQTLRQNFYGEDLSRYLGPEG